MRGSYVLLLFLKKDCLIRIGALGPLHFKKGFYTYVGSALGNITIDRRIKRYKKLLKNKKGNLKWHIDYLLVNDNVKLVESFTFASETKNECLISKKLESLANDSVMKFGSSDCKSGCKSHLHYFRKNPRKSLEKIEISK